MEAPHLGFHRGVTSEIGSSGSWNGRRYTPPEKEQAVRIVRAMREELGTSQGTIRRLAAGVWGRLRLLWDWCDGDAMWACDELYGRAASGSDYEAFGASCGDRADTAEWCTVLYGAPEAFTREGVPELDALWEGCASGRGD